MKIGGKLFLDFSRCKSAESESAVRTKATLRVTAPEEGKMRLLFLVPLISAVAELITKLIAHAYCDAF